MEVERVHTLSSSPGAVLVEILVSDEAGYSFVDVVSDDTGRGARCSPTPPRATRCERDHTLSHSPGAGLAEISVPDDAGAVLLTAFVSDEAGTALLRIFVPVGAGVGRSAPLHPLG